MGQHRWEEGQTSAYLELFEGSHGSVWGGSDLSFENGLLFCLGRTDEEESAGQGGQKKGTKR